jgi:hypothetical protein
LQISFLHEVISDENFLARISYKISINLIDK